MSTRLISIAPEKLQDDVRAYLSAYAPTDCFNRILYSIINLYGCVLGQLCRHRSNPGGRSSSFKNTQSVLTSRQNGKSIACKSDVVDFSHSAVFGETITISISEGDSAEESIVTYDTKYGKAMRTLLWCFTLFVFLSMTLAIGTLTRWMPWLIHFGSFLRSYQPNFFRDLGLELSVHIGGLIGIIAAWSIASLLSRMRERQFWKHIGFITDEDRILDGSLLPSGPSDSKLISTGILLNVIGFILWIVLRIPLAVLIIIITVTLHRRFWRASASNASDQRRFELSQRFGFRMTRRCLEFLLLHTVLLWIVIITAKVSDTQALAAHLPDSTAAIEERTAMLQIPRIWGFRIDPKELVPITSGDPPYFNISEPPTIPRFGAYLFEVFRSTPGYYSGNLPVKQFALLVSALLVIAITFYPFNFYFQSFVAARKWREMYGGGLTPGETLKLIDPSLGERGALRQQILNIIAIAIQAILYLVCTLFATGIALHAFWGIWIPGFEYIWIPYSFLEATLHEAGLSSWLFRAVIAVHIGGIYFMPGAIMIGAAIRRVSGKRKKCTETLSIKSLIDKGLRLDNTKYGCVQIASRAGNAPARAAWEHGQPIIYLPEPAFSYARKKSLSENEKEELEAFVLHESYHLANIPRRSMLRAVSLIMLGDIWPVEALTDYTVEELDADRIAVNMLGAEVYRQVLNKWGNRAGSRMQSETSSASRLLQNLWREILCSVMFVLFPYRAGYIHLRETARFKGMDQRQDGNIESAWHSCSRALKATCFPKYSTGIGIGTGMVSTVMLIMIAGAIHGALLRDEMSSVCGNIRGNILEWQSVDHIAFREILNTAYHSDWVYIYADHGVYRFMKDGNDVQYFPVDGLEVFYERTRIGLSVIDDELYMGGIDAVYRVTEQGITVIRVYPESFIADGLRHMLFDGVYSGRHSILLRSSGSIAVSDRNRIRSWLLDSPTYSGLVWRASNGRIHIQVDGGHYMLAQDERSFERESSLSRSGIFGFPVTTSALKLDAVDPEQLLIDSFGNGWKVITDSLGTWIIPYGSDSPAIHVNRTESIPERLIGPDATGRMLAIAIDRSNEPWSTDLTILSEDGTEILSAIPHELGRADEGHFIFVDQDLVYVSRRGVAAVYKQGVWKLIWAEVFLPEVSAAGGLDE